MNRKEIRKNAIINIVLCVIALISLIFIVIFYAQFFLKVIAGVYSTGDLLKVSFLIVAGIFVGLVLRHVGGYIYRMSDANGGQNE